MKEEYFKEYSNRLQRDMEFKVYGHAGKPVVVFPPGDGRFWHYELHGMVEICRPYIDAGRIQLFCVDGIDWETWTNKGNPFDRIRRHEAWFNYVVEEFLPRVREISREANGGKEIGVMTTGCSMGALHSANFFFRRPDLFDAVIAQSGLYSCRSFFGGDCAEDGIYFNSPMEYLPNLNDKELLHRYRHSQIILSVGQGAWENECLHDTHVMDDILRAKNIPAWVDYWGHDVPHDWPAWRVQLPYFLGHVL